MLFSLINMDEDFSCPKQFKSYQDYGVKYHPVKPSVINTVTCGDSKKDFIPKIKNNNRLRLLNKLKQSIDNLYRHKLGTRRFKYWNHITEKYMKKLKGFK